jgi:hypothetical protein
MAQKKQTTKSDFANAFSEPAKGFRRFEKQEFYELSANETLAGTFVSARTQTIQDRKTKTPKDIMVYRIKTDDGKIVALGGRAMLDSQFHEAVDDMFAGNWDAMRGRRIIIERGDDSQTGEGNRLGTYQLMVSETASE